MSRRASTATVLAVLNIGPSLSARNGTAAQPDDFVFRRNQSVSARSKREDAGPLRPE